ncbi:MAG TPA: hypothetical protein PKA64_25945, partial [Myxococcota bacterium]|nr:hypothetical protein [Myxococcota bacterium]
EFVLALAAAEGLRGRAFADDEVERVLGAHLDTFGRFYMHSDTHAMNRLIVDGLRKDPRVIPHIERVWEPAEWRRFHQSPPEPVREALLEHLVRPEHMGCGHLRFVMTDDRYSVRPGLVEAVLRAFHRLRWSGAPELEWVVLGGDHVEGAVMEVVLDTDLRAWSRIPLVSPQVDGLQSFVSHPQVTEYVRRGTAAFLAEIGAVDSAERLLPRICDLGAAQLGHTLRQLALGLPVFRLHFSADAEPGMRGEANPPRIEALGAVA